MSPRGQTPKTNGRWWALAALALAMLTIGLDATVLNGICRPLRPS